MEGGGAERVAALLSNHWVSKGHHVVLMPTFSGRGECLYLLDERIQLTYLSDLVATTKQSGINKIRRLISLRRFIREFVPDVVVSFLPHVNIAAVLATRGTSVPVVISERIYPPSWPLGAVMERLRRWSYSAADYVVMQTQQGLAWLKGNYPNANGSVIPNPVVYPLPAGDPCILPDHIVDAERQVLLSVGRLEHQKGFDLLIEAFKRLNVGDTRWQLVIIGEGAERAKLESLRDSLDLSTRVHLPGRAGNMGDWYRRASMYVMSSRFEGFPNTLLEAMAHGLPVVAYDCDTGPRDIIRPGVDGLLVAPDEGMDGLCRALDLSMNDKELRGRMATEAIKVRERFSIDSIASQWDEVLKLV